MLLAVMLSTESESDAHILDGTFDKILARKAGVSNLTVKRIVDTNEGQPQMQTELPISAENKRSKAHFSSTHIAPSKSNVTPQYHNDSEHSNDVPVQMPSSNGKPQQYVCEKCGQDYKSIIRFTEHLRRHSGEKPYGMLTC